jgi:hypothetical protein
MAPRSQTHYGFGKTGDATDAEHNRRDRQIDRHLLAPARPPGAFFMRGRACQESWIAIAINRATCGTQPGSRS